MNYEEKLNQLRAGEIETLKINNTQFMEFRNVWMKQEDRTSFVGTAGHGGSVVYRYEKWKKASATM